MRRWYPLLVVTAGIVAYHGSLAGPFLFDDVDQIVNNEWIREPSRYWRAILGSFRPVVTWSFAANHALGGLDVLGYHAANLLIHLLAGLVLLGLGERSLRLPVFEGRHEGYARDLALVTSLLWVVHPLQTASVTYVVQRHESMMALFYLLTLYCLLRGATAARGRVWWYTATVVACGLGMGCKEVMVTAPLAALLYDRALLAGSWREVVRRRWGFYLGPGVCLLLLARPIGHALFGGGTYGVGFGLQGITPWEYAWTQPRVILHYLYLVIWPWSLCLDYAWGPASSPVDTLPSSLLLFLLLGVAVWLWWRHPPLGFLAISFFLVLAPTSSFLPLADLAFEHRMYLPLAPLLLLFVLGGHALLRRGGTLLAMDPRWEVMTGTIVTLILVTSLCWGTIRRNQDYQSVIGAWQDVASKRPNNPRAHAILGQELALEGRLGEAIPHLHRATQLDPLGFKSFYNLGLALAELGRLPEAIPALSEAVRLAPEDRQSRYVLAVALVASDRPDEALPHFGILAGPSRDRFAAPFALGRHLLEQEKVVQARRAFEDAVRLAPGEPAPAYHLAECQAREGLYEDAARRYRTVIRLDPTKGDPYARLGSVLLRQGKTNEALPCFQKAVEYQPRDPWHRGGLALVLSELGRREASRSQFEEALRIDPNWPAAACVRAWKLATHVRVKPGGAAEAVLLARQACEATQGQRPEFLDVLGVAYASAGSFRLAIATTKRALDLARAAHQEDRIAPLEHRLHLYQDNRPFQDPTTRNPFHRAARNQREASRP